MLGDGIDLGAAGADAGEMRRRLERRLAANAGHGRMGALARRAAGAVGHRDEARRQPFEPLDRLPELLLHLIRLGRKELEGD